MEHLFKGWDDPEETVRTNYYSGKDYSAWRGHDGVHPYDWALRYTEDLGYSGETRIKATEFIWNLALAFLPERRFRHWLYYWGHKNSYLTAQESERFFNTISQDEYGSQLPKLLEEKFGNPRTGTVWNFNPLRRAA